MGYKLTHRKDPIECCRAPHLCEEVLHARAAHELRELGGVPVVNKCETSV